MIYTNLRDLYGKVLMPDDAVVIGTVKHLTTHSHFQVVGASNNVKIGEFFPGKSYEDVLSRVYGYTPAPGEWPQWRYSDMKAATNAAMLMLALQEEKDRLVEIPFSRGQRVCFRFTRDPWTIVNVPSGTISMGVVERTDNDIVDVTWDNGESFWCNQRDVIIVQTINSITTKTSKQDEYLQKPSVTDKREEGTPGIGISGGGSTTAIGRRPVGNAQRFEDIDISIGKGKVSGTVQHW